MLPKVTLLSGDGTNFSLRFGSKSFDFLPGSSENVPVAVALALQDQKMPGGKPLFLVEDMPEIVEQASDVVSTCSAEKTGPAQLRF